VTIKERDAYQIRIGILSLFVAEGWFDATHRENRENKDTSMRQFH